MENESANKIRLLLNELAILNQPEIQEGKFIYHLDTLLRIKQLTAELYLLADNGMFGTPFKTQLPVENVTVVQNQPAPQAPAVKAIDEILPKTEIENPPVEPLVVETVAEQLPPPEIKMPETPIISLSSRADEISAKISLSRRFEYTNKLFGANTQAFNNFLIEIADAGSPEKSMEKFDAYSLAQNWKRNSETVSDLKQLLRKALS